jgi:chloramphenicol 3-O-phosphotransferase
MILILNGSFGVGKTTVARLLRRRIAGSRLYDPEPAGSVLTRLPSVIRLQGSGTDDFQDIALWRKSVVRGTRLVRAFARETVIVPMAFSRREYFDEIIEGMREFDDLIKVYCLRAGIATILERLQKRGENIAGGESSWTIRKARECIAAHRDAHFGEPVETEEKSATEVADEILRRLAAINEPAK